MSASTSIEWCDHTFNPWWGCAKVSAGCQHCYAEAMAARLRIDGLWGKGAARRTASESTWNGPIRWDRAARRDGARRRVFCASMADVFEDREDLDAPRARLFDLIQSTPNLDWLLLTKRPESVPACLSRASALPGLGGLVARRWVLRDPAPNVWLGASVEDQATADARIPALGSVAASVLFLSVEPLLGPISLEDAKGFERVDWVIVGGESGVKARPCDLGWVRSLRDQCDDDRIPLFVKQLGSNVHGDWGDGPPPSQVVTQQVNGVLQDVSRVARRKNGRWRLGNAKGAFEGEWPEDLRGLRAFPRGNG